MRSPSRPRPGYLWHAAVGVTLFPILGMVAAVVVSQTTGSEVLPLAVLCGFWAGGALWFSRWELRTRPGGRSGSDRGRIP